MEDSHHDQSTRSGALIGYNDDLLNKIFLRLPVTSILRFKFVSKHWRSLLSDKRFTLEYDDHNNKPSKSPGLFVGDEYVPFDVENGSPPPFRTLDFYYDPPHGIKILQSCNGLLLCCTDTLIRKYRKHYVFNPTTKQFAIIPSVPGDGKASLLMGLAFHQTECVRYKLVCIRRRLDDKCQILIYSSDTRKWKISIDSFSTDWPHYLNGVYWNGAIHWSPSYGTTYKNHLYFKLDDEQLHTLPSTLQLAYFRYYNENSMIMYFGECGRHLHLVVAPLGVKRLLLHVYEMRSDHSAWFIKYKLALDEIVCFRRVYNCDVCDLVRGENEEDTFMVLRIPGKLIKYNVHDKSFESIFDYNMHIQLPEVHRYTQILGSYT